MPKQTIVEGIEIRDDQATIETVGASKDFSKLAGDEAFMNEPVTITVHASTDENQPPHVIVSVNGINQPIIRGVPTKVKRKYVEVLARMKETRYRQLTPNPAAPDVSEMQARTALAYPFEVSEDSSRGRSWLAHVLAEPA
jgi:hypothetical protein